MYLKKTSTLLAPAQFRFWHYAFFFFIANTLLLERSQSIYLGKVVALSGLRCVMRHQELVTLFQDFRQNAPSCSLLTGTAFSSHRFDNAYFSTSHQSCFSLPPNIVCTFM